MDASEIEDWFSENKEKLEEQYYKQEKQNPEKAKQTFDTKYRALLQNYQKKHQNLVDASIRKEKMQKPIQKFKERREEIKNWFKKQKEGIIAGTKRLILNLKVKWMMRK